MAHSIISATTTTGTNSITIDFTIKDTDVPPSAYNINYIIRGQSANALAPCTYFQVGSEYRAMVSITFEGYTALTGIFKAARYGVWSPTYKVTTEVEQAYSPSEYYPNYYPTVKHQWIYNPANGDWSSLGQADNCVAHAITTLKEIHEHREGRGSSNWYSINWVYGNRGSGHHVGEGMYTNEALQQLQTQGVPLYSDMAEYNWQYPDNRKYYDSGSLKGAKYLYEQSYANASTRGKAELQKINSYTMYLQKMDNVNAVKNAIASDGGVLVDFAISSNFDNVFWSLNNGIVPEHPDNLTGSWHTMVIIGWKKIDNRTWWICHNNWGNWADNGVCYIPVDYVCVSKYYKVTDWSSPRWTRWTTKVKQGETFNITARDWNDFIDFVKSVYTRNGWSIPTMTYVVKDALFYATRFNEVKNAIGSKLSTGITDRVAGQDILASYFHKMEDRVNKL